MPHATLWTAPAGNGKTGKVIQEILQARAVNAWQPIWVLLPTDLQVSVFRNRLLASYQEKSKVCFGVQFFNFYKLYTHLLDQMLLPQKQIEQGSVYRILRTLIEKQVADGRLTYFEKIATKPGFIDLVSQFILELKQARVHSEAFEVYAHKYGTEKDEDLAAIYTEFQDYLRKHQLVDREGAGWVALEGLEEEIHTDFLDNVGLLVVDGFINFSPLQARLVGELARKVQRTILTLPYDEARAETLYRGIGRIRERLHEYGRWEEYALTGQPIQRRPELRYLEEAWSQPGNETRPANGALQFIEAPTHEQEVRATLRQIKAQLMNGTNPEQIAILAYDIHPYADFMCSIAAGYRVPVVIRQGLKLERNPAVGAILQLLDLHTPPVDFRRQTLLDVLHSPYFEFADFPTQYVDMLEQISLQFQVVRSRQDWLEAIVQANRDENLPDEDGEIDESATRIDRALLERLQQFFERIIPPEEATPREYIVWIEDLLGRDPASVREQRTDTDPTVSLSVNDERGLSFYARVRHPLEEMQHKSEVGQNVAVRDVYAMQAFRACLNEILRAYDLLAEQMMGGVEPLMTWAQFRIELGLAVEGHQAQQVGGDYRNGRVLFSRLDEARGLIHDHIYILGLAEGLFPAQIQEDPLYSDRERKKLQDEAGFEVQTSTDRVDSGLIFYEACAMARETLTLSRPTLDEKANPWPPSILWREVNTILKDTPTLRIRAGAAPLVEETADMREAGVAVAAAISQQLVSVNEASGVLASLLGDTTHSSRWVNILRGRAIEARRENIRQPFDQFSGILRQPELIAKVAAQLGANRQWSATQFNDYGYCPFRFFSKRVLRLEELEEPEEGLDAAQLGSVQHEVLENTYLQILAEGFVIAPENVGRALELLHEEAGKCLPTAPQRWGFRPTPLWKHEQAEIMSRLTQLIKLDFSESTKSPFVLNPRSKNPVAVVVEEIGGARAVFALEQAFGMDGKPNAVIDGAAGPLKVRGKIDRIDRVGNVLIVMDYKSGTKTPKNQDIEEGRNFQMLLYLLAAQQIIQQEHPDLIVQVGMFWSIRTQKAETSAQILANDPLLEEARQRLHEYILAGREGRFQVQPSKREHHKCFNYCEFNQFCRAHRGSMIKVSDIG